MKLTWFGGTALRIYVGGSIVVLDAHEATGVDPREVRAGADLSLSLAGDDLPVVDPAVWRPRPMGRAMDEAPPPAVHALAERLLVIDAPGEAPLVIADTATLPRLGRWVDGSVVLALGTSGVALAHEIVGRNLVRPRLLVIAAAEDAVGAFIERWGASFPGEMGFAALEPGLALEV